MLRAMFVVALFAVVIGGCLLVHSYRSYAKLVDARLARGYLASRGGIFAAPRTLRPGQEFSRDELAVVLRRSGYLEAENVSEVWNGGFAVLSDAIEIRPANDGGYPEAVRVTFDRDGRIFEITGDGLVMDRFALEPEALTNDARMKEGSRRPLAFKEIPPKTAAFSIIMASMPLAWCGRCCATPLTSASARVDRPSPNNSSRILI